MSQKLFKHSCQLMPGGVNSPVRAFSHVKGTPVFLKAGFGSKVTDEAHNTYIDYVGAWGPAILGHANQEVLTSVTEQLENGFGFGAPHILENKLCEQIIKMCPFVEKVRLVNSGTEAAMTAVRLARGYTKRDLIIKFEGCYHGHSDGLLAAAGSGVSTLGISGSSGVPDAFSKQTIVLPFNDASALIDAFKQYGDQVAAVIVEPIAGNMNFIEGNKAFLNTISQQAKCFGSLVIADEVMTGFRVAPCGAQGLLGWYADITVFGKIIGGGMPLAALAAKACYMDILAPSGDVYQAGTLSGQPICVMAGLKTLQIIHEDPMFYDQLKKRSRDLLSGIKAISGRCSYPIFAKGRGGMFGFLLGVEKEPMFLNDVQAADSAVFSSFFHAMLKRNVYLPPSLYECCFLSIEHGQSDITRTLEAFEGSLRSIRLP